MSSNPVKVIKASSESLKLLPNIKEKRWSCSSSGYRTAELYYKDPKTKIDYDLYVQLPERKLNFDLLPTMFVNGSMVQAPSLNQISGTTTSTSSSAAGFKSANNNVTSGGKGNLKNNQKYPQAAKSKPALPKGKYSINAFISVYKKDDESNTDQDTDVHNENEGEESELDEYGNFIENNQDNNNGVEDDEETVGADQDSNEEGVTKISTQDDIDLFFDENTGFDSRVISIISEDKSKWGIGEKAILSTDMENFSGSIKAKKSETIVGNTIVTNVFRNFKAEVPFVGNPENGTVKYAVDVWDGASFDETKKVFTRKLDIYPILAKTKVVLHCTAKLYKLAKNPVGIKWTVMQIAVYFDRPVLTNCLPCITDTEGQSDSEGNDEAKNDAEDVKHKAKKNKKT